MVHMTESVQSWLSDRRMKRVLLSRSSGKDSAWTLHVLRGNPEIDLVGLLTTLNSEFQRVAMHGTRRFVLEAQAEARTLLNGHSLWTASQASTA